MEVREKRVCTGWTWKDQLKILLMVWIWREGHVKAGQLLSLLGASEASCVVGHWKDPCSGSAVLFSKVAVGRFWNSVSSFPGFYPYVSW